MADYRRLYHDGGTYFFTLVTYDRREFLTSDLARRCLRYAWNQTRRKHPFRVDAVCLLPNHIHCIWTLPEDDCDFSIRWRMLKGLFSMRFLARGGHEFNRNTSRTRKGEVAVWQRRFWEHLIKDEDDFVRHADYVHYNPVKHGYTVRPRDWEWSSFHRSVREGYYDPNWGDTEPHNIRNLKCVGE